jgi:hypothetical protein
MNEKAARPPGPGKYEFAIPMALLEKFREEARFVFPESRVGVWVFPPDWLNRLEPGMSKALQGYTVIAVPNAMLGR